MNRRATTLLGWALASVGAVFAVPTLILLVVGSRHATPADGFGLAGFGGLAFLVAGLAFATTGAMVSGRVPRNPIGWLFCSIGLCIVAGDLSYQYADYALFIAAAPPPYGVLAAVLQNGLIPPMFGLLGIALLLFPDGRLPSRRWWPAFAVASAGSAGLAAGYLFRPGPLDFPFETVDNAVGIESLFQPLSAATTFGWPLSAAGVALAAIAMTSRLRRARGDQRQQLKWIALATGAAGIGLVANAAAFALEVPGVDQLGVALVGAVLALLPVAATVAILRYRLYDIDVVINRTLVYSALTATLATTYLGSVLLLQFAIQPVTERSDLAVAGSTLAVAALFRPARSRIQGWVDRRFYRRRYDAARTLAEFSGRLREQIDLDALGADLRHVVQDTVSPTHVSLWLRSTT